jgi:type III restriction enzyme
VRNTVKQPNSFWLQTSSDKFYPGFVAMLKDGRFAVIEYKGADRWKDADQDQLVGNLWADRSHGRCLFVMLTNMELGAIDRAIGTGAS